MFLINPYRHGGGGGGGGGAIDATKILAAWENGVTADLANAIDLINVPSTIAETVGPFTTVWDLNLNRNETVLPIPTNFDQWTIAAVVQLQSRDGRNFISTNEGDLIQSFFSSGSPAPSSAGYRVGCGGSATATISPLSTSYESIVLSKSSQTAGTFYLNGSGTALSGAGSTPTVWFRIWDTASYHVAAFWLIDEAWGQAEVDEFHSSGSFLSYSSL